MSVRAIIAATFAPPLVVTEPVEVIRERILERVRRECPDAIVIPFTKRKSK